MNIEFSNIRVIDDFAYADVYENNNYVGLFGAEICHIEYTHDLDNQMFNQFRLAYLAKFGEQKIPSHLKLIK